MKSVWNNLWKGLIVWVSAYFSFIAFAITGGYVIVREKDNEVLNKETKKAFIVTIIFLITDIVMSLVSNMYSLFDSYIGGNRVYNVFLDLFDIAEIVTYVVMVIIFVCSCLSKKNNKVDEVAKEEKEKSSDDNLAA